VLEDGFPVAEELHLICQNVKVFYQGLGKFVVIDISEWHDVQTLAVAEIREPQDPSTTLAGLAGSAWKEKWSGEGNVVARPLTNLELL
jgi:hypothetical protein